MLKGIVSTLKGALNHFYGSLEIILLNEANVIFVNTDKLCLQQSQFDADLLRVVCTLMLICPTSTTYISHAIS